MEPEIEALAIVAMLTLNSSIARVSRYSYIAYKEFTGLWFERVPSELIIDNQYYFIVNHTTQEYIKCTQDTSRIFMQEMAEEGRWLIDDDIEEIANLAGLPAQVSREYNFIILDLTMQESLPKPQQDYYNRFWRDRFSITKLTNRNWVQELSTMG